jgi:hypothetical protein
MHEVTGDAADASEVFEETDERAVVCETQCATQGEANGLLRS